MPRKKRFPTLEIPVQFPHRGKSDLTFLIRCNFRSGKSNSPKRESFVPDSPLRFSFFHARTKNNRVRFPFRGKTDLPITFSIPFSIPFRFQFPSQRILCKFFMQFPCRGKSDCPSSDYFPVQFLSRGKSDFPMSD